MTLPDWSLADWLLFGALVSLALAAIAALVPLISRKMLP